ncbi:hypothetical protein SK128_010059 [Halocaridina rubra]|uniref:Uncharacterized protein n=1 Tax=Halocaridina rubra TaxID=373956 RepID=A0AAN8ZY71_HALRR
MTVTVCLHSKCIYCDQKPRVVADTNLNQLTILRQQKFLTSLLERLDTEENIVLKEMEEVCEKFLEKRRDTLWAFMNVEKVPDRVDRKVLRSVLRLYGISGSLLDNVKDLNMNSRACLRFGNGMSDWFEVRSTIVHKDRIVIHMATDTEKLSTIVEPMYPWTNFITGADTPEDKPLNIIPDSQLLSQENLGNVTGFITGLGSIESSYLLQTSYCVTSFRDWDLPAILTAIQYLTQLEGPMWKGIRGKGLAYGLYMYLVPYEGTINLELYKAAQVTDAYKEALNIIYNHINGSTSWDNDILESARSSLIYKVIDREADVSGLLQQSLLAYFKKVPHTYNR